MKIKLIYLAITVVLITAACQKSFLNSPPLGELSKDQLAEKSGVETVIIGAYSVLNGQIDQASNAFNSPASNWSFGDVTSDDAYKGGGGTGDQNNIHKMETYTHDATSLDAQRKWMACFEGINRANEAIKLIKAATGYDEVLRNQRIAEMRFLRGHFYFDLKKIYNRIPYIDETAASKDDYYVSNDALTSEQVWQKIEEDFKAGINVLPNTQAQPGRPTRFAAWAYLTKAYVFQKKWAEAKSGADTVISKGGYILMTNFSDTFTPENDNGREIVFAVQHSINDGSTNSFNGSIGDRLFPIGGPYWPGAQYGFLRPTQNLVNSYKTDAQGLPVAGNVDVTDTDFVDPRLDHAIARQGIPFLDLPVPYSTAWVRDLSTYGPFSLKKRLVSPLGSHWLKVNPYTNDLNYYVIRYADVLLWKAEAAIETGDLETGRQLINQVRRRARDGRKVQKIGVGGDAANYKVDEYTNAFAGYADAIAALKLERRLEFSLEGHRFFDLVRWGDAANVINTYLTVEKTKRAYLSNAAFVAGKHEYQPIPQNEIDLSKGALKQNPNF